MAVQTGQVIEVAIGKEGPVLIVGLADVLTGEHHQKGSGLHGGVQALAVARVEGLVHGETSSVLDCMGILRR